MFPQAFLSYVTFGYYSFVCSSINIALLSAIAWDSNWKYCTSVLLVWHYVCLSEGTQLLTSPVTVSKTHIPYSECTISGFHQSPAVRLGEEKKRRSILICTLTSVWMGRSCAGGRGWGGIVWAVHFMTTDYFPLFIATSSLWTIERLSFLGIAFLRCNCRAGDNQKS